MNCFVRLQYATVGATATAVIVALSLVTVPSERYDSVIARTEFAAVQLQAAVSTQIASLAGAAVTAAASAATPAAPQASATQAENDTLKIIATAAISLVVAPLWYLAFPVTLPLTLLGSAFGFGSLLAAFSIGTGGSVSLPGYHLVGALLGVPFFLVAPFAIANLLAQQLIGPSDAVVPAAARGLANQVEATNTGGPAIVADIPAAGTDVASDTGSVSAPNRRERGSVQRGRSVTQPATTTTAPAASATVVTNTETAAPTAKPPADRQSARGAAHRAERSTANAIGQRRLDLQRVPGRPTGRWCWPLPPGQASNTSVTRRDPAMGATVDYGRTNMTRLIAQASVEQHAQQRLQERHLLPVGEVLRAEQVVEPVQHRLEGNHLGVPLLPGAGGGHAVQPHRHTQADVGLATEIVPSTVMDSSLSCPYDVAADC